MLSFVIDWLLASVAFVICHVPTDTRGLLVALAAGALVAIAIGIGPGVLISASP